LATGTNPSGISFTANSVHSPQCGTMWGEDPGERLSS
jgi:hypothetical protein